MRLLSLISSLLFLILPLLLCGGSLTIFNDTPYPLTANILSAQGETLGTVDLPPSLSAIWSSDKSGTTPYQPKFSQTPYRVTLTCKAGTIYGVWDNIPSGSRLSASDSQGSHFCPKPQEKEKKLPLQVPK